MGDLTLVLRSLQDPNDKGDADDDAPAEPGDSYTHDAQVSHLIKSLGIADHAARAASRSW